MISVSTNQAHEVFLYFLVNSNYSCKFKEIEYTQPLIIKAKAERHGAVHVRGVIPASLRSGQRNRLQPPKLVPEYE